MLRFNCPGCRKLLKAPDTAVGMTVTCPKCGNRVLVRVDEAPTVSPSAAVVGTPIIGPPTVPPAAQPPTGAPYWQPMPKSHRGFWIALLLVALPLAFVLL